MITKQLVFVLGDIHGAFSRLNTFINKEIRMNKTVRTLANEIIAAGDELEVLFFQCGDFCFFWPGEDNSQAIKNRVYFLKDGLVKIFFCDGNHENHDALDELERQHPGQPFIEVASGVYFATFGSVLTLVDGSNVLFAGGAESCDSRDRIAGLEWWPQEGIDDGDMAKLPPVETRISLVVSHTAPMSFKHNGLYVSGKLHEQSRHRLDTILNIYRPKMWRFGHFHDFYMATEHGCEWKCLDCIDSGDVWYDASEAIIWPDVSPKPQKIMVVGDLHGGFNALKYRITAQNPSLILQCGDFGFWPNQGMSLPRKGFRNLAGKLVPIHFCDGNHENHPKLLELVQKEKVQGALLMPTRLFPLVMRAG